MSLADVYMSHLEELITLDFGELVLIGAPRDLVVVQDGQALTVEQYTYLEALQLLYPGSSWRVIDNHVLVATEIGRFVIAPDGEFGLFTPDGRIIHTQEGSFLMEESTVATKVITAKQIEQCPHKIIQAGHYREDGTCRCNDPTDRVMVQAGYTWSQAKGQWV